HELGGQLPVGQARPPRADVHFVDAHRLAHRLALGPCHHPVAVVPGVLRGVYHRRGGGRPLGGVGHRVGLLPPYPVRAADRVLVPGALGHARYEELPHAGAAERAHRVRAAVPVVEVTGDADTVGVRCPDGEGRAGRLADLADVRAEHAPQFLVPALADQVQVELTQRRQVAVRIVAHLLRALGTGG